MRPGKGDESDPRRGSVYPDELCYLLANSACSHLSRVRQLRLDPAYSMDGKDDVCAKCGNIYPWAAGLDVYPCENCTAVYHWRCIPRGTPKPKKRPDGSFTWYCPECHLERL